MIFAIFTAGSFDLRKQQLSPRASPVHAPAQSSRSRGSLKKKRQVYLRLSSAAGASAGQGRLPWRQAAALDAGQSCCTCVG